MTIFFEPDARVAESMMLALGSHVLVVDSPPALTRAVDENSDDLLVVIGADVDLSVALDLAADYRVQRPELGVVLLRRRVDVTVLAQALRAGVREVVTPDNLPALSEACQRSLEVSRGMRGATTASDASSSTGRVVTVFAAKGGAGKTTLATNLAAALAQGGRQRVCLLDLDLAFGDVAIAMQLMPTRTIIDAVAMQGSMDQKGVASVLTPHSPGLDTVLAPLEPGQAEKVPVAAVTELVRTLRTMFDYVVIDTPPAFTEHVLAAFDLADSYVLLATLDIPALKNLRLTLDMLDLLGYARERWHVVLNRSDSKVGLSVDDVEKTLRVPISGQVPSSRSVSASINKGVPLVLDEPNHPASLAIRRFADARLRVAPAVDTGGLPSVPPRERRSFAFLRKGGSR